MKIRSKATLTLRAMLALLTKSRNSPRGML